MVQRVEWAVCLWRRAEFWVGVARLRMRFRLRGFVELTRLV